MDYRHKTPTGGPFWTPIDTHGMNEALNMDAKPSAEAAIDGQLFFGKGTSISVTRAEEFRDLLPPDKLHHYRDGYSMADAAKVWVAADGRLPPKIAQIKLCAPRISNIR
jgi:hypothetical protein